MKEKTKQKYLNRIDNLKIDYVPEDNIVAEFNVKDEGLIRIKLLK